MSINYDQIKAENITRYGTDIGRIGPMLLANRYDDRSHFIYELLQNAEDALRRRDVKDGPRSVEFTLTSECLSFSHFGRLFSEADVKGICGIGESTKGDDLTAIGRFGIGFKAVYAFTDSPEIHSGTESFAIDSFVWPRAIQTLQAKNGQTIFRFPLRPDDCSAHEEIAAGLQRLGVRTLLFLREIDEISWAVESGPSGTYLREVNVISPNSRRVTLVGRDDSSPELIEENWLVFSREIFSDSGTSLGYVEVAFGLDAEASEAPTIRAIPDSKLAVFFPTIVETHVGCLFQGPYRTTPSRDNVPPKDEWNQHLVSQTASLLVEALRELRDRNMLSVETLETLPIDSSKFPTGSMFLPVFQAVKAALSKEDLLPSYPDGYVAGRHAKIARTQELRHLLSPGQLATLHGSIADIQWLHEGITRDRTRELRKYLVADLGIEEIEPESFVTKISRIFLDAQSDAWISNFYVFLSGQPALRRQGALDSKPIIRLENGTHVVPFVDRQPQAFLPGSAMTDFPTVRAAVCKDREAFEFLRQLNLSVPDPVDDVVKNVLPRYQERPSNVFDHRQYERDIKRIVTAFDTDSKRQRDKLISALREVFFIVAADTQTGKRYFVKPAESYLATQRLKALFQDVAGVRIVDDSLECLRGESVRDLLEASGASEYLQPVPIHRQFEYQERVRMRLTSGDSGFTRDERIEDYTLRGLDELLGVFRSFSFEDACDRANLLWDALCDVQDRRGTSFFSGTYRWFYYSERSHRFEACFVSRLNQTAWVPDDASLQTPDCVVFEEISPPWKSNPFLLSKILFKPPVIQRLAEEAGIEFGVINLLKKLGLTSEAELRAKLAKAGVLEGEQKSPMNSVEDAIKKIGMDEPTLPIVDPLGPEPGPTGKEGRGDGAHTGATSNGGQHVNGDGGGKSHTNGSGERNTNRASGTSSGRPFISYVGAHPDDEERDPDGLDNAARMALEEKAIALILAMESAWKRTPTRNPGFDLFKAASDGKPKRWCEVKAMTGTLHDRPVGLSHTQFKCAQEHTERYWLYVVEQAGSENARIIRIQDPAGKSRTFTFDHGWLSVADGEPNKD